MKYRKSIGFLSFFLLPITLNYVSPVLIVQAGFEKTFTIMHIIYGVMILCAIFFGGAWCSYICPFGALQDLFPNDSLKKKWNNKFLNIKFFTGTIWLALILIPIIIYGFQNIIIFYHMEDTKVTVDSFHGIILYYIITTSILIIAIGLGRRAWCRYICPMYILNYVGIKIASLIKLPSLKIVSRAENCTQCRKCNNSCLMGLDVANMVRENKWNRNECIQCAECINICKCNVLKRTWKK